MELKDVILSTLAEMEEQVPERPSKSETEKPAASVVPEANDEPFEEETEPADAADDEMRYLESVKERLLVLFEGFQSPNNVQIEAKIDLTLNFLEYLLATVDTRIDKLKKKGRMP